MTDDQDARTATRSDAFTDDRDARTTSHAAATRTGADAAPVTVADDAPLTGTGTGTDDTPNAVADDAPGALVGDTPHTGTYDAPVTVVDDALVRVADDAPHASPGTDLGSDAVTDDPPHAIVADEPRTETDATAYAVAHVQPGTGTDAVAYPDATAQVTAVAGMTVPSGATADPATPSSGTGSTGADGDGRGRVGPGDLPADAAAPGSAPIMDAPTGDERAADGPTLDERAADNATDDTLPDDVPTDDSLTGDAPSDDRAVEDGARGSEPGDGFRPVPDRRVTRAGEERPVGATRAEEEPRRPAAAAEDSAPLLSTAVDSSGAAPAGENSVGASASSPDAARSVAATDPEPAGPTRMDGATTGSRAPGTTLAGSPTPTATSPTGTPRTGDIDIGTGTEVSGTAQAHATPAGFPLPRTTRADDTTSTTDTTRADDTTSTASTGSTGTTGGGRGAPEPTGPASTRADAGPVRVDEADGPAGARTPESGPAGDEPAPARPVDPERALAAVGWRLHPETLREEAPDPAELRRIRDGLTGKLDTALDNRSRARLLSLRAVASRVLGDADDAVADARLALTYAEATGELRRTALARARLAEVLRWRGEYAEADRLFAEANSAELPDRLRALLHEHAGRCCYDQGRLTEACLHFERALDLRRGEDAALNARTLVALDAVAARAARDGFGPAPRGRSEVLGTPRYPVATFDEEQELWGYADADGELVIRHRYAEVQPFHEGLAWVRRPEASRWALIDTSGAALIEANNGYRSVGAFAEGLSWVSMDGKGRWMAVDRTNIVQIPPGYEEVRPFRNGLAAVRQNGGWGAVDHAGEVVVPTRYHGLGTLLADGRHLDGFTEEGLAVVELAGRRGVVDRHGRVRVAPAYPTLVIHPVAFLVTTEAGRWGALDRHGEPLIDPVHPGRAAVAAEIDRLLADANPVL
ncbi:WG repeat-containing protein [Micromonospora sp. AKA38]|uniref:WG repeat-containing protein n=1 Tax=Micromonospora sp. AKA38 TaxID=2733861 RepID=UPI0024933724|nr:WG repeat-containing protein [Micromonospora sp. AKA38]